MGALKGELDDESLASIIAHAIGLLLSWHQESPEHTRNATTSSRTWRPAGGPRGGRPQEFEERSFEAYRAYYEWVPRGEWTTEYTIRLNNGGVFKLPTTYVEAMYSPEMFGELPNKNWEIAN